MIVGYARTSTVEQKAGFDAQLKELETAGCEKIFQEQVSSVAERLQLNAALEFVRDGDTFVATKIDRLARSITNLLVIIDALKKKKVALRILNLGMDTSTPLGKLIVALYLNRRLWPFTALNSWTGCLSIGLNPWKHCT